MELYDECGVDSHSGVKSVVFEIPRVCNNDETRMCCEGVSIMCRGYLLSIQPMIIRVKSSLFPLRIPKEVVLIVLIIPIVFIVALIIPVVYPIIIVTLTIQLNTISTVTTVTLLIVNYGISFSLVKELTLKQLQQY